MQNDHGLASSLGHPSALLLAHDPRATGTGRYRPKYGARGDVLLAPMFRLIYYLYARRLVRDVGSRPTPRHVGIILDGNRRHGRSRGITEPREVYDLGADKLDEILEWCAELDIPAVTLWVFSTDNFQRPAAEVSGILASIEAKLTALACDPDIHRRRVRVRAIGCLAMLPEPVLAAIRAAERATSSYDGLELNIAVAYGGRQEITDAVRALLCHVGEKQATLAEAIDEVTPEAISGHLYTAGLPDPDLYAAFVSAGDSIADSYERRDTAAARSHRPRRPFRDCAARQSMAGDRRRDDRAAHRNCLVEVPRRGRKSLRRHVDTRTESYEVAVTLTHIGADWRRCRARPALRTGPTEPPGAAKTAHGGAGGAEIHRVARVKGSRAAQGIRAADRGLGALGTLEKPHKVCKRGWLAKRHIIG